MNFFLLLFVIFYHFICFYFFDRRNKNKGKNQNPQSKSLHLASLIHNRFRFFFFSHHIDCMYRLKSFYFSRHLTKISIANSKNVYDCVQKTNSVMKYFLSLNTYLLFLSLSLVLFVIKSLFASKLISSFCEVVVCLCVVHCFGIMYFIHFAMKHETLDLLF